MARIDRSIAICIGTRPEIIKMAPVYLALRAAGLSVTLIHSGQHDSMAWPLYEFFGMTPDVTVDLARTDSSLEHLSSRLIESISAQWRNIQPRAVLVHGDTSTAAMAALTAFYRQVPIGHVEAGLRTHAHYDPFPEEMNRVMIGRMARWHFAPTRIAVDNLANEGIRQHVHQVGNTAIDAARWGLAQLETHWKKHPQLFPADLVPVRKLANSSRLLLVTAHRRENWGQGIEQIALAVRQWLHSNPDYTAVWPVHGNPAVADTVRAVFAALEPSLACRIFLTAPLDYPALLWVMQRSWMILTDSGGIQEESAALNKPVLVLRDTTERPELISSGRGLLTGARRDAILHDLARIHGNAKQYQRMQAGTNPFGDGRAAQRITTILKAECSNLIGVAA
jgi:UDP-N-acetylglucosamine 2-epimerase (non-hydrolysing)